MDGPRRPFPPSVNLFCLLLTFLTTTIAGTLMSRPEPLSSSLLVEVLTRPRSWIEGLGYALPVLFILGAHEMGHYLACRYYRIDASLPFFLPGPNLFGTFGAVIRIRAPFTNRRALFDIGIAGPLAGFAAAIPVLWHGLTHATLSSGPPAEGTILLPSCLLLSWVYPHFFPGGPEIAVHLPGTFAAAWLGFFATFLNLLPIGQADGGHML